jgi:hypothetical protein
MTKPVKKTIIVTARLNAEVTPGEGSYADFPTVEEALDYEREAITDDPMGFIDACLDASELEVRFEDPDQLAIEDVWPDRDAEMLRTDVVRREWPQLADALDRYCESKAASE